jgi:hypothetical protein
MKKTILVMLIAIMTATPCLAQEIEPEGNFSIEGTLWHMWSISLDLIPPFVHFEDDTTIGFIDSSVFWCDGNGENCDRSDSLVYADLPFVSIVWSPEQIKFMGRMGLSIFVMQSSGVGVYLGVCPAHIPRYAVIITIGAVLETHANWTPPISTYSFYIYPGEGEQETMLTNVGLHSRNTTFQDNPPVEISFDPPDGLTVSNIDVKTNEVGYFDLEIAVDAPIGYRDVIVTYDDGNQVITETDAFEVLPKIN